MDQVLKVVIPMLLKAGVHVRPPGELIHIENGNGFHEEILGMAVPSIALL